MFDGFAFAVAFADLLFDFFNHGINGRVQIAFLILGKKIGAADGEADGAAELLFRDARVIVFKSHAGIHHSFVELVEFLELGHDVIFDGFGQRDVVCGENQFHVKRMAPVRRKIQFFLSQLLASDAIRVIRI